MNKKYFVEKQFSGEDFKEQVLPGDEYEGCSFDSCMFSGQDFSEKIFIDCSFYDCDFSMANLDKTALRNVYFQGCKLIGLHIEDCKPFLLSINFQGCQLDYSTFHNMDLKKMEFADCKLIEADFTGSDMTGITFSNCDLNKAIFENCILDKVDFRTTYNFTIDPEINSVKKTKFSSHGLIGLLSKYDIEVD